MPVITGSIAGRWLTPAMRPSPGERSCVRRFESRPRVALGWLGDGGAARGDAHEAMNFAGVRRLPVVFVIDNNQFAYSTPNALEFTAAHLADRAQGYGFDGVVVDGTDVLAVYREARRAIEKARAGGGPTLIESVTLRMEGHAVHDDAFYVPKGLHEAWARKDPIERHRAWLLEHVEGFTPERDEELRLEVKTLLNEAVRRADESPLPDPATLLDGVYADPEELDTPHHR